MFVLHVVLDPPSPWKSSFGPPHSFPSIVSCVEAFISNVKVAHIPSFFFREGMILKLFIPQLICSFQVGSLSPGFEEHQHHGAVILPITLVASWRISTHKIWNAGGVIQKIPDTM